MTKATRMPVNVATLTTSLDYLKQDIRLYEVQV